MTAALHGWLRWRSASRLPKRRCPARFPASNPGSPTSSCCWCCCNTAGAQRPGCRACACWRAAILLGKPVCAPGFWLSAAGACVSLLVLALARYLPSQYFGPISLSVLAAFGHIWRATRPGWLVAVTERGDHWIIAGVCCRCPDIWRSQWRHRRAPARRANHLQANGRRSRSKRHDCTQRASGAR